MLRMNSRACKAGALPAELHAHSRGHSDSKAFTAVPKSIPSHFRCCVPRVPTMAGFMCGAVCKCGTHKALDFSDVVLCVFLAGPVSSGPHNAERHRRNKLDGYRALAVRPDSGVTLFSRRKSLNRQFPYIVEPLADLPAAYTQYVIDFQSETVGRLSHLSPNQYKEPNWLQVDTGTR